MNAPVPKERYQFIHTNVTRKLFYNGINPGRCVKESQKVSLQMIRAGVRLP